MATLVPPLPQTGQVVRVRSRQYLVEGVVPGPTQVNVLARLLALNAERAREENLAASTSPGFVSQTTIR
jgi:hypothetical protein